jgi:Leucine-rich repeat (LRR) protein
MSINPSHQKLQNSAPELYEAYVQLEQDLAKTTKELVEMHEEYNKSKEELKLVNESIDGFDTQLNKTQELLNKTMPSSGTNQEYEKLFKEKSFLDNRRNAQLELQILVTETIAGYEVRKEEQSTKFSFFKELISWSTEPCSDQEYQVRIDKIKKIWSCFLFKSKRLDLSNDAREQLELTSIPKAVGKLTQLEILNLDGHQISELPLEIWKLPQLKNLKIRGNRFQNLSTEVRQLTQLKGLDISNNQLTAFPVEIGQLSQLAYLAFDNNPITTLPGEIGQMLELQELEASQCQLVALPPELSNLTHLKSLSVWQNCLRGIPGPLARLPSTCKIDVNFNQISRDAIRIFLDQSNRQRALNPSLGPALAYSIHDDDNAELNDDSTIGEIVTFWLEQFRSNFSNDNVNCKGLESVYTCQNPLGHPLFQPFFDELTPREIGILKQFLIRLKRTEDFKHPSACQALTLNTIRMLHGVCTNKNFKVLAFTIIENALATCGDRVADAFNDIYLQWLLYCNSKDLSIDKLASLLIGCERLDIVTAFAKEKIAEKSLGDHIETILYFKVKLKEKLNLPVATERMLYGAMAGITDDELEVAAKRAQDRTSSPEQIFKILMSHNLWPEQLVQENPNDFQAIDFEARGKMGKVEDDAELSEQERLDKIAEHESERKALRQQLVEKLTRAWIANHLI